MSLSQLGLWLAITHWHLSTQDSYAQSFWLVCVTCRVGCGSNL